MTVDGFPYTVNDMATIPTTAAERARAFKARVREVSTATCPNCGGSTTSGMLASLGQCSACRLAEYAR